MVTLKDIALACNLSVSQTSRALNNFDDVSEETKKRVIKIAEEMGYVKNLMAQSLVNKNFNQVAVIVHGVYSDNNVEHSVVFDVIRGVNKFAQENKLETVVHFIEKMETSYINFCNQRGITGVIIFCAGYKNKRFQEIVSSDFPCVVIDIPIKGKNKGCIVVDNEYYSILAMEEIIKRKRKKIAMLSGIERAIVSIERKRGYEIALKKHKMKIDEELIIKCNFSYDEAYQNTKILLEKNPDIDGVFCASDLMALGFIKAAKELGKKIPKDISVFGFDGIVLGEFSNPKLSTIKQNNLMKGYLGGEVLYKILKKEKDFEEVIVPCEVLKGSSC